jgi:hypothetical protein
MTRPMDHALITWLLVQQIERRGCIVIHAQEEGLGIWLKDSRCSPAQRLSRWRSATTSTRYAPWCTRWRRRTSGRSRRCRTARPSTDALGYRAVIDARQGRKRWGTVFPSPPP